MQDIVFYAAANETLGVVRDYANSRNEYAPTLVLGVSVCLRMRLFAGSESAAPFPVDSFSGITSWKWRMDSDFDRETPYKLTADSNGISVQTVTDTIDGETMSFTEFAIQISDMNTLELATWLGTEKKKTGLTGELVGYDSSGNAVFVLQIDDFTVRNRLAGLNEPTSNNQEYLTRSETENLVSSVAAAKQDKLTSANAGAGIAINSGGTISMACAILGATNGVKIVDGSAQFDPETAIGADGSTRGAIVTVADGLQVTGGTASIDDASVKDVLIGLEGGTASIRDEVVTPGNLRGALSVGQAVDVSCPAGPVTNNAWLQPADGWDAYNANYLNTNTITKSNVGNWSKTYFGWTTYSLFPKFADNLYYLYIVDVRNTGAAVTYVEFVDMGNSGASGSAVSGVPVSATLPVEQGNQPVYTRIACVMPCATMALKIQQGSGAAATITLELKNWRQYEVTALTDDAIAYIAQLPDPDAFFRSGTIFQVRDKYLVKQDMVCPWIYTIGMPDNSDLTVAAGLSYKIKYTNDNAHKITVDTIPQDAYGWDAHIQMFIKGTSSIVFQKPLVLMDALTSNAGHNLLVKFRNGQALVYVDDLNAGYMVISTTGVTSGTLNYGLVTAPTSDTEDKYIIFGSTVNGLVCDFGTATAVYGAQSAAINLIGNGIDETTISGTLTVPTSKNVNMQDLTVTGSTINGGGNITATNMGLDNSTLANSGTKTIASMHVSGTCYTGQLNLTGTLYGTAGSNLLPLNGTAYWLYLTENGARLSNVTVIGGTSTRPLVSYPGTASSTVYYIDNCYFKDYNCTGDNGAYFYGGVTFVVSNTSFIGGAVKVGGTGTGGMLRYGGKLYATDCTWENNSLTAFFDNKDLVNEVHYAGTITLKDSWIYGHGNFYTAADTVIDVSQSTSYTGVIFAKNANATAFVHSYFGDNTSLITLSGTTATVDACSFSQVTVGGVFTGGDLGAITITAGAKDPWIGSNAIFASPLDASAVAGTIKLSGTTFTSASLISGQPDRIQLPAGSTVSFAGNTNAADTRILQAPIMVVGNNASSPSGSATIINAAGSASTITGIGTWIDKEGDNDFRPVVSNFNVSNTASSGAGSLLDRLTSASAQATTSGMQQFVGFVNGGTQGGASFATDTNIVSTTILTKDCQALFGGDYTVSSGGVMTVDQTTKTTTIAGAVMVMSDVVIPSGATVKVSGGGLTIESMNGAGGTIELEGNNAFQMTGGTIGRVIISSGTIINLTSSIEPDAGITLYGGASLSPTTIVCGGSSRIFEDVEIHGTTITDQGIIYGATVYSEVDDDHYIRYTEDDGATSSSVIVTGQTVYLVPGGLTQVSGT